MNPKSLDLSRIGVMGGIKLLSPTGPALSRRAKKMEKKARGRTRAPGPTGSSGAKLRKRWEQ